MRKVIKGSCLPLNPNIVLLNIAVWYLLLQHWNASNWIYVMLGTFYITLFILVIFFKGQEQTVDIFDKDKFGI